ncbi:restriction endonuclease subunit S [Runella salmonicolor]|uniref:Restriction endonuclease subunit S n=1 Tax=Runella salmonicolor TaxID=2950278 RepID=A0ABT1FS45_9BACT|nr:restriction endonuclease subunit S [Runella salmonicolor]MCP1384593.1 restriction endonuclease subunit S [Runella salmonicolor]
MSEWKTYKLSELVEIKYGKDHKHLADGDIPVYGSGGIMRYVDTPLYEKESILIPRKGTLSNLFYLNIPFWSVDTMFYTKIKEGNNGKYLYYLLKSMDLASMNVGSAVPSLTTEVLNKVEISVPDEPTQIEIAQILTSLDDKIELNLQMNQTLEAMAQALFKEWFVNFKFPNFDGELENGLPKGWKKCQVKDICEANASTLNSKDEINEVHYIEISEVDRGIIKNISIYKRGEEPSRAKRKLKHGDTVLSTVRPNRGSYFLSIFPNENLIASTGFAVFSPTTVPFSYLYIFLTNDDQLEFYGKMADGAAYPAINQSVIMNMEVIFPTKELLEKYHDVSGNLLTRIFENLEANKILSQTRDTLLPKLMSGAIALK